MEITGDVVAPNVLITLDRSCSMTKLVGVHSKWQLAVGALTRVLSLQPGTMRLGLTLFPDRVGDSCTQGPIPLPVAANTEATIAQLLQRSLVSTDFYAPVGPCSTNIDTAMAQAATEPALMDATRERFVLLLTDGKQSNGCAAAGAESGTLSIVDTLRRRGVGTFVVGFGDEVDPVHLSALARAGGVPAPGPIPFYRAEDGATLEAALTGIASRTKSCSFTLTTKPADPQQIYAFADDVRAIARDPSHRSGFDYDSTTNTVTLYGAPCTELKAGAITDVDIVFGCPKLNVR